MTRCRVTLMCVVVVLAHATTARAEFDIPWLEKLSGPGPFVGLELNYRFYCRVAPPFKQRQVFLPPWAPGAGIFYLGRLPDGFEGSTDANILCNADNRIRAYSTVGIHWYRSTRNDLIADPARNGVTIWGGDWKYAIRIDEALDLSTGVGVSVFSGPAFDAFARLRWLPLEVRFYPFVIDRNPGGTPRDHDNLVRRALYVTAGVVTFLPGFREEDFCGGPCAIPFREDPEALVKFGIHVDLGALGELLR